MVGCTDGRGIWSVIDERVIGDRYIPWREKETYQYIMQEFAEHMEGWLIFWKCGYSSDSVEVMRSYKVVIMRDEPDRYTRPGYPFERITGHFTPDRC